MPILSRLLMASSAAALVAGSAPAAETIAYTYDARGRLVQVAHTGTVNNGITTSYGLDKADNRTSMAVTGVAAPSPPPSPPPSSPISVADASFEEPDLGNGYAYNPSIAGATFTGSSGLAGNGSAWGFASAPDGDQAAFLQAGASISLSASGLTPGANYAVSFFTAQRPGYGANPVTVAFNGASLGTFTPGSTAFSQVTTTAFTASGSSGTISFTTPSSNVDISSAIDKVTVAPPP